MGLQSYKNRAEIENGGFLAAFGTQYTASCRIASGLGWGLGDCKGLHFIAKDYK